MNIDILKYIALFITAPLWMPFAKALWEEFNDALRPDGGLFGPEPTQSRREEILAEIAREEPRLVHEPLAHVLARQSAQSTGGSRPGIPPRASAPKSAARRRPGFRA